MGGGHGRQDEVAGKDASCDPLGTDVPSYCHTSRDDEDEGGVVAYHGGVVPKVAYLPCHAYLVVDIWGNHHHADVVAVGDVAVGDVAVGGVAAFASSLACIFVADTSAS